jgi:hypothetical protein
MPDADFERTFADLAHASLRDRAPVLLDHLIGFQLLDKSDDETHAVGVWGFKVGNELMYAPVFFLNGQLKGDELLYIKSQDAFVPLKENWINYLLNRRPHILGETEPKEPAELGISQPDFETIARPPYTGSKYASRADIEQLVKYLTPKVAAEFSAFLPVVADAPGAGKRACLATKWSLPNFLKQAGRSAAVTLVKSMRSNQNFADAVLKYYTMDDIIKAASDVFSKAAKDGDKNITGTAPRVRIMFADKANVLDLDTAMLSDSEQEKLWQDRYLVQDKRKDDEVSKVYTNQISASLNNPCDSGWQRVLMASGKLKPQLLLVAPKGTNEDNATHTMIIDLTDGNRFRSADIKDMFVSSELPDTREWQTKFDNLPAADTGKRGDKIILVSKDYRSTVPLFVRMKITNSEGQTMYYGEIDSFPYSRYSSDATHNVRYPRFRGRLFNVSDAEGGRSWLSAPVPMVGEERPYDYRTCFVITGKDGGAITRIGNDIFIPNGYKLIKISDKDIEPWKLRDLQNNKDDVPKWEPAKDSLATTQSVLDVKMQLFKSASVRKIQPVTDGIEFWLKVDGHTGPPMSKLAAVEQLVIKHGLCEPDALNILKQASRKAGVEFILHLPQYLVKQAQGMPSAPPIPEPRMGSDPNTGVPIIYPQEEEVGAGGEFMQPGTMDMDATYRAEQAANQGQKEVMDTAVIGGLVKTMDPDAAVDQYLGDLILGLDRVGRILFMYYWHYDKFKDRYGSQDMPELEDSLKNVFDGLGDLVIFLKQKTIEPELSSATAEAELQEVI